MSRQIKRVERGWLASERCELTGAKLRLERSPTLTEATQDDRKLKVMNRAYSHQGLQATRDRTPAFILAPPARVPEQSVSFL